MCRPTPILISLSATNKNPAEVTRMNYPTPAINCLPVELLQQVFLLILNDVQGNPSIFSFGDTCISADVASPPLLLTRVCRLWRDIAHSTTAIWSRIHVALPSRIQPLKPFLPSLLEVWLARSALVSCPSSSATHAIRKPDACHGSAHTNQRQIVDCLKYCFL